MGWLPARRAALAGEWRVGDLEPARVKNGSRVDGWPVFFLYSAFAPGWITRTSAAVAVPIAVMIVVTVVVVVVSPVVAETAFALLARLAEFVAVVIGLPAILAMVIDVAVQLIFPILDVSVATIPVIGAGVCGTTEKQ